MREQANVQEYILCNLILEKHLSLLISATLAFNRFYINSRGVWKPKGRDLLGNEVELRE